MNEWEWAKKEEGGKYLLESVTNNYVHICVVVRE